MAHFIALDIETTGLDQFSDEILEIGVVSLDQHFKPLRAKSWLTCSKERLDKIFRNIDRTVIDMHRTSGLIKDINWNHLPIDPVKISEEITAFIVEESEDKALPMVGSSISFDRGFLAQSPHWRGILDVIHYRSVDATSILLAHQALLGTIEDPDLVALELEAIAYQQNVERNEMFRELPPEFLRVAHRPIFDALNSAALIRAVFGRR
ncbi:hypothetical protein SFC07_11115 [Corynebacterium callunae]|uniref:hypothetical protein n=1 Tax=Corynebacterium callunae TaxID=1721 RepID=UPI0039819646